MRSDQNGALYWLSWERFLRAFALQFCYHIVVKLLSFESGLDCMSTHQWHYSSPPITALFHPHHQQPTSSQPQQQHILYVPYQIVGSVHGWRNK